MDQEKKTGSGAPSSDTTSALFVSARKKQLEQQEVERRAKEKEDKRLAAEAEVQRLEKEVEERKRKAEEEALRVAEEARAKKEAAAENPDAILGAQPKPKEGGGLKLPNINIPKVELKTSGGNVAVAEKKPLDKKLLIIIGAAVAVVAVVIIIIAVVSGGGGGGGGGMVAYNSSQKGISFSYPSGWIVDDADASTVLLVNDSYGATVMFSDITNEINEYMGEGSDIITATERAMEDFTSGLAGQLPEGFEPQLQKSGSWVQGSATFSYTMDGSPVNVEMWVTVINERVLLDVLAIFGDGDTKKATADYDAIVETVSVAAAAAASGGEATAEAAEPASAAASDAPAGYKRYTSGQNSLTFLYPESLSVSEINLGFEKPAVKYEAGDARLFMVDYTAEARSLSGDDALDQFLDDLLLYMDMDTSMISDLEYYAAEQTSDGAMDYALDFWYGSNKQIQVSASIQLYESKGGYIGKFLYFARGDTTTLDQFNAITSTLTLAS